MHSKRTLIIMVIAVIFSFGCSNSNSNGITPGTERQAAYGPQLAQSNKVFPNVAIYIADSGDDANSGRIATEPIETIRRAVAIANSLSGVNVSILFMGDTYSVAESDLRNDLGGTIAINGPHTLSMSNYGPSDEKIHVTSEFVSQNIATRLGFAVHGGDVAKVTIKGFIFDGISLSVEVAYFGSSLDIKDNLFTDSDDVNYLSKCFLDVVTATEESNKRAVISGNSFIISPQPSYSTFNALSVVNASETNSTEVSWNTFSFPGVVPVDYDGGRALPKHIGVYISQSSGKGVEVIHNLFKSSSTEISVVPVEYVNVQNMAIVVSHLAYKVRIIDNNYFRYDGLHMVSQAVSKYSPDSQEVRIENNCFAN